MNTLDGPNKPNPAADRYGINRFKQGGSREWEPACKPGSVEDGHSSAMSITGHL